MAVPATTGALQTKVSNMLIGDYIIARYWSGGSAGQYGGVDSIGTATAAEIPFAGLGANAAGSFYFVKAEKGLLIADRGVHNSISWDTLNTAKVIQGLPWNAGNIIPTMTSNTTPSPIVLTSSPTFGAAYDAWKLFDKTTSYFAMSSTSGFVQIDLGISQTVTGYSMSTHSSTATCQPRDWTFKGSMDGTNWTTLHTVIGQSVPASTKVRYQFSNKTAYRYYKIDITNNNGGAGETDIQEMELFETAGLFRSLTGGVSYADANGNSFPTDQSKGAWPTNNEWDKYIVNFPANKIQAGKVLDDVFHWVPILTWSQDTPMNGMTIGGLASANNQHVNRGYTAKDYFNISLSSGVFSNFGFRPVFGYKE